MSLFTRLFRNVKAQVGSFYDKGGDAHYDSFNKFSEEDHKNNFRKEQKSPSKHHDKELMDCYSTLEVPFGSDLKTVRNSWKTLLKQYHPDRHHKDPTKQETATKISAEVTASYKYIENYLKKKNI